MSVTFHGTKIDPTARAGVRIVETTDEQAEDSVGFNLANGNARAFLRLLEIPSGADLYGAVPMAEMVRAVQRAIASFDYRVDALTRKGREHRGAGGCRVFEGGVDPAYFERRLRTFADLLADWIELGADGVSWS